MDEQSILRQALEQPAGEARAAWLDEACGVGSPLRQRLDALLRSPQNSPQPVKTSVPELQATLMLEGDQQRKASAPAEPATPSAIDHTVVLGDGRHSVLKMLEQNLGHVPRVALQDGDGVSAEPVVHPSSPEMPQRDTPSRYRLDGEIARGGMGAILKGRDTDLGRDLAIKVLLEQHANKPEVIERFIEEAQIGGQLQHPGIAPVYELGQFADRRPYFSMKLVKGETLSKLLASRDNPADDRARFLKIFEQVCQTVAYAHSRGVIHRDLKPANIMVGAFGEVQVMDWGLAKVLQAGGVVDERKAHDKSKGLSIIQTLRTKVGSDVPGGMGTVGSQTQMGSVMGTPAYMPPEQALGEVDHLDERADVFGLGAILCEILTGKPPYVGDDGTQIFRMASRGKLTDCYTRLETCGADAELVGLTKQCLELEPADRPRNAGVLAQRVTGYLESVESKLRQAEVDRAAEAARVVELRRRRKLHYALAGLLFVGLLVAGFAANHFRKLEGQQRELAESNLALAAERESQRQAADAARQLASQQKAVAEAAKAKAEERERAIQATLYTAEMNLAGQAAEDATGLRRVGQITEGWEPVHTLRDLRGWEWYYLDSLQHADRLTLTHPGGICVCYRPDGLRLASGGRDGLVRIWDPVTGKELLQLVGNSNYVHEVAWSPDGLRIATAGRDMTVRVWDAETGKPCAPVMHHTNIVDSVCWSPDGKSLAAKAGAEIVIWNAETGAEAHRWSVSERESQIAWNPKSNQLATYDSVLDAETGKTLWKGPEDRVEWRPDGTQLATISADHGVRIYSAQDGKPLFSLPAHSARVHAVRWSRSGRELATASADNTIRVWKMPATSTLSKLLGFTGPIEPEVAGVLRGHKDWVIDVSWSANGKELASVSHEGVIKIWDWPTRPNPIVLKHGEESRPDVIWSRDGATLAAGGALATFWDVDTGKLRAGIAPPEPRRSMPSFASPNLAWNSQANVFAIRRENATVLYDVRTGSRRHEIADQDDELRSIALSPDGSQLATSAYRKGKDTVKEASVLRIFDTQTGKPLTTAELHSDFAGSLAWSADGKRLASGGWTNLAIVNAADGQLLSQLSGATGSGWIHAITWNPQGDRIALAYMNHVVSILDVATGREPLVLVGHTDDVNGVSWSPDGSRLATASRDLTVRVWNAETGTQSLVLRGNEVDVETVAWSPDGTRLAAANNEGEVWIWDASISYARANSPLLIAQLDRRLKDHPDSVADLKLRMRINERAGNQAAVKEDQVRLQKILEQRWESKPTSESAQELGQALVAARPSPAWTLLIASDLKTQTGSALLQQDDGSIVAEPAPIIRGDTYTLRFPGPLRRSAILRLESLPQRGQSASGSDFFLTELRAEVEGTGGKTTPLTFRRAAADIVCPLSPESLMVDGPWGVIDGHPGSHWNVGAEANVAHELWLEFADPLEIGAGDTLVVHLDFHDPYWPRPRLEHFRLTVGGEAGDFARQELLAAMRRGAITDACALAAAHLVVGTPEKAKQVLAAAPEGGEHVTRQILRILALKSSGDKTAAGAAAQELHELLKTQAPPRMLQGLCFEAVAEVVGGKRRAFDLGLQRSVLEAEVARLTNALEEDAELAPLHVQRGLCLAQLGRWRESAADYARAAALEPTDRIKWCAAAPLFLLAGDHDTYKQHCATMLKQFRDTKAADVADTVCKTSLLWPDAVPTAELPIEVLREGASDSNWQQYHWWFFACNALVAYREGDYDKAIAWTEKMQNLVFQPGALALVVRAMAQEKLGDHEQAVKSLAAAEELIPADLRATDTSLTSNHWPVSAFAVSHDWLMPEVLRREAAALVRGKKK